MFIETSSCPRKIEGVLRIRLVDYDSIPLTEKRTLAVIRMPFLTGMPLAWTASLFGRYSPSPLARFNPIR